jgi:hypothetical protein
MLGLLTRQACSQTLQLPTFSFTTVNTTVSVPDQGSAFLGGIDRAASGGNQFGVPGLAFPGLQNRSFGQNMSSSGMRVSATIHDFDAMDQALLNTPTDLASSYSSGMRGMSDVPLKWVAPAPQLDAVNLAGNWRLQPPVAAPVSMVVAEEADREARRAARLSEADNYFARGQQAESDGKPNVAKIFYQMAARRATGELKQQALARLDVLSGHTTALAKNTPQ